MYLNALQFRFIQTHHRGFENKTQNYYEKWGLFTLIWTTNTIMVYTIKYSLVYYNINSYRNIKQYFYLRQNKSKCKNLFILEKIARISSFN